MKMMMMMMMSSGYWLLLMLQCYIKFFNCVYIRGLLMAHILASNGLLIII